MRRSFNNRFCSSLSASRSCISCSSLVALAKSFFFCSSNCFISASSFSMLVRCWTAARSCADALAKSADRELLLAFVLVLREVVLMIPFVGWSPLLLRGLALDTTLRGPVPLYCCCCCCPMAIRYSSAEQSPYSFKAMGEGAGSPFCRARVRSMLLRTVTAMKFALKFW